MKRGPTFMFLSALVCLAFLLVLSGCSGIDPGTQSGGNTGSGNSGGASDPSRSAEFVYSIVGSSLSGFSLDHNSKLQPFPIVSPNGILNPRRLVISPDSKWLFTLSGCPPSSFLCSGRGAVFSQSINADGKLGNPQTVIPADQLIDSLIADSQSHFVYALTEVLGVPPIDPSTGCEAIEQTLSAYVLAADGKLTPVNSKLKTVDSASCPDTSTSTVTRLVGFIQDSSGRFLWLAQTIKGRGIDAASLLSIPIAPDGTLGTLKSKDVSQFTLADRSVIAAQYLVTAQDTAEAFANNVVTFRLSDSDAEFAAQCPDSIPACHFVAAIAASPDGRFIYTVSQPASSWQINALALNSVTGALVPIGTPISLPQNAIAMPTLDEDAWPSLAFVDSQGHFLFVARNGDGMITTVPLDVKTGGLGAAVDSPAGGTPNAIKSTAK